MITLVYPSDQDTRYLFWDGLALGPFDSKYDFNAVPISFDGALSAMQQTRGIFGENAVVHDKLEGDVEYIPLAGHCVPYATSLLPQRIKVPVLGYPGGWMIADAGLGINKMSNFRFVGTESSKQSWNYAVWRDESTKHWWIKKIQTALNNPTRVNAISLVEIQSVSSFSGYTYKVVSQTTLRQGLGTSGVETGINWFSPQSYDFIRNFDVGSPQVSSPTTSYKTVCEADLSGSTPWGVQTVKQRIDTLVGMWFQGKFPLTDRHFGDLAMEASSHVNANHVNMIAFLKDLRHPTEMIPKLKNLRNLKNISNVKNYADDYLTVKYGVLPTISDLKAIAKAAAGYKAYVDKLGFPTYSAGHIEEKTEDNIYYCLEQHIKLAIGDEDSGFQELIGKLDNIGILPTCENLWDLVPYSFVVDWFVGVGDLLERVDTHMRLARLNIQYVTMSRKTTISGPFEMSAETPFSGSATWVHYHRWVSDQCPVPPLTLQSNPQDFNHWLESFALLIQRAK